MDDQLTENDEKSSSMKSLKICIIALLMCHLEEPGVQFYVDIV